MIAPKRAPVRPRVLAAQTGDSLPLDTVLEEVFAGSAPSRVCLTGPAGCGKTTALQHLASVFAGRELHLIDEPQPEDLTHVSHSRRVVFTNFCPPDDGRPTHTFRLAPWREDEWLEYLLAVHKDRCASVMARLNRDAGLASLQGNPQLCSLVLDQFAADESIATVRAALARHLAERGPSPRDTFDPEQVGLDLLLGRTATIGDSDWHGLLRHRPVQVVLAGAHLLRTLRATANCQCLGQRLPRDLVQEVGAEVAEDAALLDILRAGLDDASSGSHAVPASLLHASGRPWSLTAGSSLQLAGAYLDGVNWPGLTLARVDFSDADLSRAVLRQAKLEEAHAVQADLQQADLREASLREFVATSANLKQAILTQCNAQGGTFEGADLEGADLQGADLGEASFVRANLTRADFRGAQLRKACLLGAVLDEADFTNADLSEAILEALKLHLACFTGARFTAAQLMEADLEGLELPGVNFAKAQLSRALLTATVMPGACFDGACLAGAGLAEIDWEGASLRDADLTGASFHMGSTRCGLVNSPIACEGSRTGFYTDESTEQDFKAPEEIRKANLCYADLRGAHLDAVDFYLVDLRHAKYDRHQEQHLRRCGAILDVRG